MVGRVGAMVLMAVVVAGCGVSPRGTVKVDSDEYAKAVKQTKSLVDAANGLIDDAYVGEDVKVGRVRSDPCGEPYGDDLRQLEVNTSMSHTGTVAQQDVVDRIEDGLDTRGWKKRKGEDGTYRFEHTLPGGATLKLYVDALPDSEQRGRVSLGLSARSTCMEIPKDVADKS